MTNLVRVWYREQNAKRANWWNCVNFIIIAGEWIEVGQLGKLSFPLVNYVLKGDKLLVI